jgi:hypothetical protein
MSGRKQEKYFKFLEALEDASFRTEFQADPQSKLGEYGIEFADLTPEVVKDDLPSPAEIRAFRLALEKDANENPLSSHAHLIWNQLIGRIPE